MELEGGVEPGGAVGGLPHIGGLDGLRALAVLSVMAYHDGFAWLPGGFYGVDAFFVLSGYLITSLLVAEWRGTGTVRFGHFWARRARRLLPALIVLVTALAVVHLAWPWVLPWPDPLGDAGATLGYVANWHFVLGGTGYFAVSGPQSPLLHTWSLAIEEQFYLVWPLLVVLGLGGLARVLGRRRRGPEVPPGAAGGRRRLVALAVVCGLGALASAAWMWLLTPQFANLDRAYYGTDTRAQALLVGATLAVVLAAAPAPSVAVRRVVGVLGLVGLAAAAVVWHFVAFYSALAFHGGFLLASLASAAVVAAVVVAPAGVAGRMLSLRPLRYVGRISYGMYLWHWPITLAISAPRTHLDAWGLFACRLAATLAVSALSFHFLEMPIRRGTVPARRALIGAPVAVGLSLTLLAVAPAASLAAAVPVRVVHPKGVKAPAGPPVRVMVVGDSMAGSLGAALAPEAPAYGVQIINEGHPGCAVTTDEEFRVLLYRAPPGAPCQTGQPTALLDKWREWVDEYRPQVVIYLARVDLVDQEFDGTFSSIDDPAFDAYFRSQLDAGVGVLSSRGAHVVLMTSPYYDSTLYSGGTVPEDAPQRVTMDDTILRQVASTRPDVTVFPLGSIVSPDGYQQDVDGVDIRCQDGVHLSSSAGEVVGPALLPELVRLGRAVHLTDVPLSTTSTTPVPPPPPVPAWYHKLPCYGLF